MNAETTASHITAVMKMARTHQGLGAGTSCKWPIKKRPSLTRILRLSTERPDSQRGGVSVCCPCRNDYVGYVADATNKLVNCCGGKGGFHGSVAPSPFGVGHAYGPGIDRTSLLQEVRLSNHARTHRTRRHGARKPDIYVPEL